jgi:hypothetical protein
MANIVLLNSGFRTRKNLFEYYPQFGHALSKILANLDLDRKRKQNIVPKGDTLLACANDIWLQFVRMSELVPKYSFTDLDDLTPLNFNTKH